MEAALYPPQMEKHSVKHVFFMAGRLFLTIIMTFLDTELQMQEFTC